MDASPPNSSSADARFERWNSQSNADRSALREAADAVSKRRQKWVYHEASVEAAAGKLSTEIENLLDLVTATTLALYFPAAAAWTAETVTALRNLEESLKSAVENPRTNAQQLSQVADATERLKTVALAAPASDTDWRLKVLDITRHYKGYFDSRVGQFQAALEAMDEQYTRLQTEIGEALTAQPRLLEPINQRLDESQRIFEESKSVVADLRNAVEASRLGLERERELVTKGLDTLQTEMDKSRAAFTEEVKTWRARVDSFIEDAKADAQSGLNNRKDQADAILEDLRQVLKVATLGTSTEAGEVMAAAFADEIDKQKDQADLWRRGAVATAGLSAVSALWLTEVIGSSGTTNDMIGKLSFTLLLAGVASYFAGQSGRHRRREENAKSLSLKIRTFGPFTAGQSPEALESSRAALIPGLFGSGSGGSPSGESDPNADQLSLLSKIFDLAAKMK